MTGIRMADSPMSIKGLVNDIFPDLNLKRRQRYTFSSQVVLPLVCLSGLTHQLFSFGHSGAAQGATFPNVAKHPQVTHPFADKQSLTRSANVCLVLNTVINKIMKDTNNQMFDNFCIDIFIIFASLFINQMITSRPFAATSNASLTGTRPVFYHP